MFKSILEAHDIDDATDRDSPELAATVAHPPAGEAYACPSNSRSSYRRSSGDESFWIPSSVNSSFEYGIRSGSGSGSSRAASPRSVRFAEPARAALTAVNLAAATGDREAGRAGDKSLQSSGTVVLYQPQAGF